MSDVLAVTVHGPAGALDLVVPGAAAVTDVAREYAAQAGVSSIPILYRTDGEPLLASSSLADAGLRTGAVLVATTGLRRSAPAVDRRRTERRDRGPGPVSVLWLGLAAGVAVLAGWCGAHASGDTRLLAVAVLVAAGVLGALPLGPYAERRGLAVPAFASAAAFAASWDPQPERLPMTLGLAALAAAVAAAVVRSFSVETEAVHRVWMIAGTAVFLVTLAVTLLGWAPRVAWSVLLAASLLASRFVPAIAVEVPDQYLVDFERLAVTAWSARDRTTGRRVRTIVPESAVATVARRASLAVTAACGAILVVCGVSAPLLLRDADLPVDRVGARLVVLLTGGGLLLAARSYRHVVARGLLRAAGLACWVALAQWLLPRTGGQLLLTSTSLAIALGVLLVGVAVATGRGWRSAWWSRRAEVAEGLCASFALALTLVSSGVFRLLWELTS